MGCLSIRMKKSDNATGSCPFVEQLHAVLINALPYGCRLEFFYTRSGIRSIPRIRRTSQCQRAT